MKAPPNAEHDAGGKQGQSATAFLDLAAQVQARYLPFDTKSKALNEAFVNSVFNLQGPKQVLPDPAVPKFVKVLVVGNLEIMITRQIIQNARKYLVALPRGVSGQSSEYLSFVVHGYLNEVYILESRMCAYIRALKRATRGPEMAQRLGILEPELSAIVRGAFKEVHSTRGTHMHEERFRDEEIGRLSSLEIFMTSLTLLQPEVDFSWIARYYRREVRRTKEVWCARFAENESGIDAVLERYYSALLLAITDQKQEILPFA
jgi:hypothetical protein